MKWLKAAVLAVGIVLSLSAVPVHASVWDACGEGGGTGSSICADKDSAEASSIVKQIINLLLYAIGALSVIMIIFSGLKYINSRGDAESIKSAKNTLQYAVVGLIVALVAFVIVNFVIQKFGVGTSAQEGFKAIGGTGNESLPGVIGTVVDLLLYFVGALSVIMIIYGGFKYVTSAGDTSAVASAKNTILYAVIGVIVSVLVYSIVHFAVDAFKGPEQPLTAEQCQQIPVEQRYHEEECS